MAGRTADGDNDTIVNIACDEIHDMTRTTTVLHGERGGGVPYRVCTAVLCLVAGEFSLLGG